MLDQDEINLLSVSKNVVAVNSWRRQRQYENPLKRRSPSLETGNGRSPNGICVFSGVNVTSNPDARPRQLPTSHAEFSHAAKTRYRQGSACPLQPRFLVLLHRKQMVKGQTKVNRMCWPGGSSSTTRRSTEFASSSLRRTDREGEGAFREIHLSLGGGGVQQETAQWHLSISVPYPPQTARKIRKSHKIHGAHQMYGLCFTRHSQPIASTTNLFSTPMSCCFSVADRWHASLLNLPPFTAPFSTHLLQLLQLVPEPVGNKAPVHLARRVDVFFHFTSLLLPCSWSFPVETNIKTFVLSCAYLMSSTLGWQCYFRGLPP